MDFTTSTFIDVKKRPATFKNSEKNVHANRLKKREKFVIFGPRKGQTWQPCGRPYVQMIINPDIPATTHHTHTHTHTTHTHAPSSCHLILTKTGCWDVNKQPAFEKCTRVCRNWNFRRPIGQFKYIACSIKIIFIDCLKVLLYTFIKCIVLRNKCYKQLTLTF